MFNKEGIPFFAIMIPFLCVIFISFFSVSYYLKLTQEDFDTNLRDYKVLHAQSASLESFKSIEEKKRTAFEEQKNRYIKFAVVLTLCIVIFMILFTLLMLSIINDIIKKYKTQVAKREEQLENLNANLSRKVKRGIEEAKEKDKAILRQSKLARLGGMISMIAHQWRQPLTELSGILMELETATRFKKVNEEHILNSIERSDKLIEFMSNTIDDFRNFYKPDKIKENFFIEHSCKRAYGIIDATLKNLGIEFIMQVKKPLEAYGYPSDFSQVIINILSNAKDILVERNILNPRITLIIESLEGKSCITIKDNAGGIKKEYFDVLFDPYFSTKDSGTGLGLYISKHIIEKNMSGQLSVKNDEEGAVFTIVLEGINHE